MSYCIGREEEMECFDRDTFSRVLALSQLWRVIRHAQRSQLEWRCNSDHDVSKLYVCFYFFTLCLSILSVSILSILSSFASGHDRQEWSI